MSEQGKSHSPNNADRIVRWTVTRIKTFIVEIYPFEYISRIIFWIFFTYKIKKNNKPYCT